MVNKRDDGPAYGSLDERLDRLEVALLETQRTLTRVVALMDGNKDYRIVGIPDQLAAYIKANEDWKSATQIRVTDSENRLKALENNRQIVIAPATAALLLVIGALCLIIAYFVLTWLQSAG